MSTIRRYASWLRRTPFHPQWLMPKKMVCSEIRACRGFVLDVGAADGWVAAQLESAEKYISLDYPDTAVRLYGTRPDVFADASCLPFADASIEAVACYEVLEHVRQPDAVLAEIARVLAPGGMVELTMPFLYPVHDAPYDYQRWTPHGWSRSLTKAGLVAEEMEARSHSLHAAATAMCLSLAGSFLHLTPAGMLFRLPLLLLLLPAINLTMAVLSIFWPSWEAMTVGYRVLARKPLA